VHHEKC